MRYVIYRPNESDDLMVMVLVNSEPLACCFCQLLLVHHGGAYYDYRGKSLCGDRKHVPYCPNGGVFVEMLTIDCRVGDGELVAEEICKALRINTRGKVTWHWRS